MYNLLLVLCFGNSVLMYCYLFFWGGGGAQKASVGAAC